MFRPANPTAADYAAPFPDFIISAVPGAADVDAAVKDARKALTDARRKEVAAREKLTALTTNGEPKPNVKRADWQKADDAARATAHAAVVAARILSRAERARFSFMYGLGNEPGALDAPEFTKQVEPLFAEASRRAKEHLDALTVALTDRDEFAAMLGRTINVDGGNWGVRHALADVSAFVDATLVDEETRAADEAKALLNRALGEAILTPDRKLTVVRAAKGALDSPEPVAAVANVLRRHGLTPATRR